ncbi:MAG: bifunctional [glutamate--ammonia ligase]-adenylyl-L-tyrosine phosphorylase/[glutamate--ammonia-ligase] adenylyltransferase [Acidiferrobacteraceae bacterium]|nr:bifunctional [glutamate--ammonia ligase]-adenylyl-L-tyrosine phosphorylase/[glutamate--ammonia-ligase] adenylyltransferase [Acidiferrobacteraceae bacterium]|tara:strand:+ start:677 stop:3562 length:2886 start_codon:yes stop_codon:yes gene_type:complete
MESPASAVFEEAVLTLAPLPAEIAKTRFQEFLRAPHTSQPIHKAANNYRGRLALKSLVKVMAISDFISNALLLTPGLCADLLSQDDVLKERVLTDLKKIVGNCLQTSNNIPELMISLRIVRRREIVRIGWRDLAGLATLDEVMSNLSLLADEAIRIALIMAHKVVSKEHGYPIGAQTGRELTLVVLGLGKLGGKELNFSSDVDLIFAYPESGVTNGPKSISNQEFFTKVGQNLIRILSEHTSDGFVFRTDMRLRPNGDSGPLVLSFSAINQYYITHGREWERYALIKARPVAGNSEDTVELIDMLKPFVYRKYLDFGCFEALRLMKNRITRELLRKNSLCDIKLGTGGIREIEFIVQVHQLIRGGREPQLQTGQLSAALDMLASLKFIDNTQAQKLRECYVVLRKTENRLQAADDRQTHSLPEDQTKREQLATSLDFMDWNACFEHLRETLTTVHKYFDELFMVESEDTTDGALAEWNDIWLASIEKSDAVLFLTENGFEQPEHVLDLLDNLKTSYFYHTFSRIGRDRLEKLMPAALSECSLSDDPMIALSRLIELIEAIGRRSAYLSLLYENSLALTQLVRLITASRGIASWIKQHPAMLDELLDPINSYQVESKDQIAKELARKIADVEPDDLEILMDVFREFRQGYTLRLAAADIAKIVTQAEVSKVLSSLAESILEQALVCSTKSLVSENNEIDVHSIGIVAYGKLGSKELGYNSDLDLIFLVEEAVESDNDLHFRNYNRLLQRLINLLTTRTRAGQLYPVDLRLRPDGKSGIPINSLNRFSNYQLYKAHSWEHQALVRARMISTNKSLMEQFERTRTRIIRLPRDKVELKKSVTNMRNRTIAANCQSDTKYFDLKIDRGGILDLEFLIQYLVLRWANIYPQLADSTESQVIIRTLTDINIINNSDSERLIDILASFLKKENLLKLQEKPALIPHTELGDERRWVRHIWEHFMGESN